MSKSSFKLIAAADSSFGLGKEGSIPWRLSADMKFFREITTASEDGRENTVIMGRKTWDSLPHKFRPLPGRNNLILSRTKIDDHQQVFRDLESALEAGIEASSKIFCIGGAEIYRQALQIPMLDELLLTFIDGDFDCDVFLPDITLNWKKNQLISQGAENGFKYRIESWVRK